MTADPNDTGRPAQEAPERVIAPWGLKSYADEETVEALVEQLGRVFIPRSAQSLGTLLKELAAYFEELGATTASDYEHLHASDVQALIEALMGTAAGVEVLKQLTARVKRLQSAR